MAFLLCDHRSYDCRRSGQYSIVSASLPPPRRLPVRAVTGARRLARGRRRELACPLALRRRLWRARWDEALGPVADQVRAVRLFERLAHVGVVLGLPELQHRALEPALALAPRHVDLLARARVQDRVVDARGDVHGHRDE